ncbi:restriction endonuclease [Streptomyces sp. NPDC058464]|uniref:restriction endonuclease n=1 Tax=Streptomyces sp. NPDC058464 TaxID=3346511 RepID=UPI00366519BC
MFDEDGSLDPLLKFLLYVVLALAIGKMLWKWLTEDVSRWITVDLWNLIADHPWWTGLTVVGGLGVLILAGKVLSFFLDAQAYGGSHYVFDATDDEPAPDLLTYKMKQLSSMTATGFEQACADLLARDGFRSPRRVGGAGDLGVDVTARDDEDRLLILQCKCAVRRFDVSPTQLGGIWRNIPGSPDLPGRESARGQQHVRNAEAVPRRSKATLR